MRVKSDVKKNEIIGIARKIFLSQGYSATSMASIAAQVGGSKATLYGYFKSKEDLFSAVVQAVSVENIVPVLDALETDTAEFATTLRTMSLALVRYFVHPEAVASYRLAVAESARFPQLGQAFYEKGRKPGQQKIAAWMQRQIDAGRLHAADPDIMAEQLTMLCKVGPANLMLLGADLSPGDAETERLAHTAVSTFLSAYGSGALRNHRQEHLAVTPNA